MIFCNSTIMGEDLRSATEDAILKQMLKCPTPRFHVVQIQERISHETKEVLKLLTLSATKKSKG